MLRTASGILVLAVGTLASRSVAAPTTPAAGSVRATMELNQNFYYIGDPLNVRLAITNNGTGEVANPVKSPLFGSFVVADAQGKSLEAAKKVDAQEPARPAKLAPNAFYGAVVDLSQMYPQLRSKGRYKIKWSADGLSADEITVTIIPKFEPSKDYSAKVETEQGTFTIDLLKRTAPLGVKAVVDLANAGFYDGLLIHEARGDQLIAGGDPTGSGSGQAPMRYPAELAAVPIVVGSVLLKPAGLAPPANGSQFVITLQPQPTWVGQFTVVGQVVEGLDVVRKISNVATTDRPGYKPLKDIHTIHVTILERAPAAGTTPAAVQ
jgi:peptidylprolyl isomerase